jgi:hypothetical protein
VADTIVRGPWAGGTSVSAYPASALPAGATTPSGTALSTGSADANGAVTFTGLSIGIRYVAIGAGHAVQFQVKRLAQTGYTGDRERLDALEEHPAVATGVTDELAADVATLQGEVLALQEATAPVCLLTRDADQTGFPDDAYATLSWNVETQDPHGMFDISQPTRITIPEDGVYVVAVDVRWSGTGGTFRQATLRRNGTTDVAVDKRGARCSSRAT